MKVLVAANSQGTAHGLADGEEPYPSVLRDLLAGEHEVVPFARSGWSIRDFVQHVDEIAALDPDVVVVQVGIVECARRILSTREKRLLARVRGSHRLTRWLHDRRQSVVRWRHRLRMDTRLYTTDEFAAELDALIARLGDVVILQVPPFGDAYEREHFPFANEDIALFNAVLRERGAVRWFDVGDDLETIWQPGTVHLTAEGHRLAARRLAERLPLSVRVLQ